MVKTCKAILDNGQPCPNLVEGTQDYCPYHLAQQTTTSKKAIGCGGIILGALATLATILAIFGKIASLFQRKPPPKRKSKGRKRR